MLHTIRRVRPTATTSTVAVGIKQEAPESLIS